MKDEYKPKWSQLNYLKLSKRAQNAAKPLERKFDEGRSKCYANPGPWVDYDEEQPPTKAEAFYMCDGCPMLVECGRFASALQPYVGVWAGEVWSEGKRLHS